MDRIWHKPSKLVLGFDIGTTCRCTPEIQRVTKWPGQGDSLGNCRLPSWIWYTEYNRPIKFGAEAFNLSPAEGEERGWQLVKYFKLHLHPYDMGPSLELNLEPLPNGVSISQIYTDFFRYLYCHAKLFFEEHNLDGEQTWQSLSKNMEIVVAHPNGWGNHQQGVLRAAAVQAGLSSENASHQRILFVSEAEASLQYCLSAKLASSLVPGMNLVICDAGGSTVDTTVYNVTSTSPTLKLDEVKSSALPSTGIQAGSIFVDAAAESYISSLISQAEITGKSIDLDVDQALHDFSNYIKPGFSGTEDSLSVKVGNRRLNHPQMGIRGGRMKLTSSVVKSFLDVSAQKILASVASQASNINSPYYFLVGGFGDSPYLKAVIKQRFNASRRLVTNNDPSAKAVADGAAIWAVVRNVDSRATRYSYGVVTHIPRDEHDMEHLARPVLVAPSGEERTTGAWSEIIPQNTVMQSESSIKSVYYREYSTPNPDLPVLSEVIFSTRLPASTQFLADRQGNLCEGFVGVCTVAADLQNLQGILVPAFSCANGIYWILQYTVCIRFGGTEISAFLEWEQNGKTMTGPATIIPLDST
ncbi:hypothetical protein BDV93DRAFT_585597 [Ceratobasidium sp. AG-I]|nr:hypothetical protein BDV93DRAFT_585597 [Ceratobasidium sp. AG-I]